MPLRAQHRRLFARRQRMKKMSYQVSRAQCCRRFRQTKEVVVIEPAGIYDTSSLNMALPSSTFGDIELSTIIAKTASIADVLIAERQR